MTLRIAGVSDAYEVLKEHGQGGFGITYQARRRTDGLLVVVKTLRLERLKEWKSLELFEREAKVLRGLNHPNIPAYVDAFSEGDPAAPSALAIVQELIPGEDLARRMRHGPALTEDEMLSWFVQILEVLTYLHGLSPPVIHRDISPKNILYRPDGRAFLVDFGAVQAAVLSTSTLASTAAGTFGYSPMEQFIGRAFPASDLYGLAMTYLAVATGREPEDLPLDGVRVNVREAVRANARLTMLLHDMTEPDPGRRLGSAREALERLAPILPRPAVAAAASPPPAPAPPVAPVVAEAPRTSDGAIDATWLRAQKQRVERLAGRTMKGGAHQPDLDAPENFVLSADGSKLLIATLQGRGWVIDCATLEATQGNFDTIAANDERHATSPDLRLRASKKGDRLVNIVERASRKQLQQLRVDESPRSIGFSPDAHFLVCVGDPHIDLFGQKGERIRMEGDAVAFASDGRRLVVARGRSIRLGELVGGQPEPRWLADAVEVSGTGEIQKLALGPDDRLLLVVGSRGMALYDLVENQPVRALPSLPWGDTPITNTGFTADGRRVVVCGERAVTQTSSSKDQAAFFWSVDGSYLGAIGVADDRPVAQLWSGVFAYLNGDAPGSWWHRRDVVRAVIGEAKEASAVLPEEDRLLLADLEERVRFFATLQRRTRQMKRSKMQMLIEKTQGLTHLLPIIAADAARAEADAPRFGTGRDEKVEVGFEALMAAVQRMAQRSGEEQQVLYEDLLRKAETEERAEREVPEPPPPPPPPIPAAVEQSPPRDEAAAERCFQDGVAAERREDGKWFRKKDYAAALTAFAQALALGHRDAAAAVVRVRDKVAAG